MHLLPLAYRIPGKFGAAVAAVLQKGYALREKATTTKLHAVHCEYREFKIFSENCSAAIFLQLSSVVAHTI